MRKEEEEVLSMYGDLLDLKRPVSKEHPPMDMSNRAAQFLPFAALTGFDEAVRETARLTSPRKELTEERKRELDEKVRMLEVGVAQAPEVELTHYVEDSFKEGGAYVTVRGKVRKIDEVAGVIIMSDLTAIRIEDLSEVEILR